MWGMALRAAEWVLGQDACHAQDLLALLKATLAGFDFFRLYQIAHLFCPLLARQVRKGAWTMDLQCHSLGHLAVIAKEGRRVGRG
jgi:hypothetical protein